MKSKQKGEVFTMVFLAIVGLLGYAASQSDSIKKAESTPVQVAQTK